jgi:hypothetical protein
MTGKLRQIGAEPDFEYAGIMIFTKAPIATQLTKSKFMALINLVWDILRQIRYSWQLY